MSKTSFFKKLFLCLFTAIIITLVAVPILYSQVSIQITCPAGQTIKFSNSSTASGSLNCSTPTPVVITNPLNPTFAPTIDTNSADYPSNIWATGPLEKVQQHVGTPGPLHWVQVSSTKNEIQSFQIHVQAPVASLGGPSGIAALNVTMSDLVNARTGEKILASSTDIVVYKELYMNVTIPTSVGSTFYGTTGFYPDALLPAVDPYFHQTTNAFPVAVAAGANQSIWVDVHVPSTVSSGFYAGKVTVSNGTQILTSMPVIYSVWDWSMPSTSSLPSATTGGYGGGCVQWYGSIPACGGYPSAAGGSDAAAMLSGVDASVQMLDNRYTLQMGVDSYPPDQSWSQFSSMYGCLLSGTPCTNTKTILPGAKVTSWNMDLLANEFTQSAFQSWETNFTMNGWAQPFYFLVDEPGGNGAQWSQAITTGNAEHAFGVPIPTVVTADLPTSTNFMATNSVDRLIVNLAQLETVNGLEPLSSYQAWMAAAPAGAPARSFWSYQACSDAGTCSNSVVGSVQNAFGGAVTYPNYDVDGTPIAARVMEWLTFMHGQTGELYYYVDICDYLTGVSSNCGVGSPGVTTTLGNPLVNNYYSGGWGDGTLIYPASSTFAGTKIPIWLPSIRLKMIRDGMQDYEYLNALTKVGQSSFVQQELSTVVTNSYTFISDPNVFLAARQALGAKLHAILHP
jgi:hypothetical protein